MATTLDIGGSYGDERGCAYAKQPFYAGETGLTLLTPTEYLTNVSACEFVRVDAVGPGTPGRFVATVLCGSEGDGAITIEHLRIEKAHDGSDSYAIFDSQGNEIGRGTRCE